MKMTNNQKHFATSDMGLVIAISLSQAPKRLDKTNPRRIEFIFSKDKNLEETVEKYYQRKLKIEVISFLEQMKVIKTLIYRG